MRKGFINGLVTGGLLGAVVATFVLPQFKKQKHELMHETKKVPTRARRMIRGVKNAAEDWMK